MLTQALPQKQMLCEALSLALHDVVIFTLAVLEYKNLSDVLITATSWSPFIFVKQLVLYAYKDTIIPTARDS